MSALEQAAQSEWLTLALAMLNVLQVLMLAVIADRSRRVRSTDKRKPR